MSGQRGVWGRLVATAFTWTIAATMIVVGTAARRAHADCQNQAGCFAISDTMDSPGKCTIVNPISGPIVIPYYDVLHSDLEVATVINGVSIITDVDTPGSVGDYPSAATDTLDHTVISYYDVSNGNLKFAIGSGSVWSLTTVDAPGRVGLYTSIARVPGGFGIAYYDSTKGDLKYAEKDRCRGLDDDHRGLDRRHRIVRLAHRARLESGDHVLRRDQRQSPIRDPERGHLVDPDGGCCRQRRWVHVSGQVADRLRCRLLRLHAARLEIRVVDQRSHVDIADGRLGGRCGELRVGVGVRRVGPRFGRHLLPRRNQA